MSIEAPSLRERFLAHKRRLTLPSLADPRRLAEWMGWEFESEVMEQVTIYGEEAGTKQGWKVVEQPKGINDVKRRFGMIRAALLDDWHKSKHNHLKRPRTHAQFIRECLREGLGIKGPGSVDVLLALAKDKRPDLYQPTESTNAQGIPSQ